VPAPLTTPSPPPAVLLLNGVDRVAVALLLARYGITLELVSAGEAIPGSNWGDSEAGLRGDRLYARLDTHAWLCGHGIVDSAGVLTGAARMLGALK